jgi:hypothetical protein
MAKTTEQYEGPTLDELVPEIGSLLTNAATRCRQGFDLYLDYTRSRSPFGSEINPVHIGEAAAQLESVCGKLLGKVDVLRCQLDHVNPEGDRAARPIYLQCRLKLKAAQDWVEYADAVVRSIRYKELPRAVSIWSHAVNQPKEGWRRQVRRARGKSGLQEVLADAKPLPL